MSLLDHGACKQCVQHQLHPYCVPCSPTPVWAVNWFSAWGGVVHLKEGILWLPAAPAACSLKFFLLAAYGFQQFHISPPISQCIPSSASTNQMDYMLSLSAVSPVLVSPVFPIRLRQVYLLGLPLFWLQLLLTSRPPWETIRTSNLFPLNPFLCKI